MDKNITDQAHDLCVEIEKLPASKQQTKISDMAVALSERIRVIDASRIEHVVKASRVRCAHCGQMVEVGQVVQAVVSRLCVSWKCPRCGQWQTVGESK